MSVEEQDNAGKNGRPTPASEAQHDNSPKSIVSGVGSRKPDGVPQGDRHPHILNT